MPLPRTRWCGRQSRRALTASGGRTSQTIIGWCARRKRSCRTHRRCLGHPENTSTCLRGPRGNPTPRGSSLSSSPSRAWQDWSDLLAELPREQKGKNWNTTRLDGFYRQLVSSKYLRRLEDIPTGNEQRRYGPNAGDTILGAATLVELFDLPADLLITFDSEFYAIGGGPCGAPEEMLEHWGINRTEEHPIVGGHKIVWQFAGRLFNIRTRETVESVCWTNAELGLQDAQLQEAKAWVHEHLVKRGTKAYNFSRSADATMIEWCAGQPYDIVARDARQLEMLLTTIYERMEAPCSQDLKRGSRTQPGTAGVGLADAAWWKEMRPAADRHLSDADGEPHMAPCDAHDLAQQLASLRLAMEGAEGLLGRLRARASQGSSASHKRGRPSPASSSEPGPSHALPAAAPAEALLGSVPAAAAPPPPLTSPRPSGGGAAPSPGGFAAATPPTATLPAAAPPASSSDEEDEDEQIRRAQAATRRTAQADAAAAAPPVDPTTPLVDPLATHAPAEAQADEADEAHATLGPNGGAAASASRHLTCAGCLDPAASLPCTCAAPSRLTSDAAGWRVCAPWDARVLLTRAELDALLLPAKRKGVYSAADYE